MLKIASWNVNSLNVRLPHVLEWITQNGPDVLGLQETKCVDEKFPIEDIKAAGYEVAFAGQKTYNGVAILSKQPIKDVETDLPGMDDPQRRVLAATIDGVRVINLYVPNGSEVGSEKYAYKLKWLNALHSYLSDQLKKHDKIVVMGDFNIAPEDQDVHDPEAWVGSVHVSPDERKALQRIEALGLEDTFRLFDQDEKIYSWWDYRMLAFRRNRGLRIDLIFANDKMVSACKISGIDKEPRKAERPSDHAPVYAVFDQ